LVFVDEVTKVGGDELTFGLITASGAAERWLDDAAIARVSSVRR
jgi:hypothetical protein